MRRMRRGRLGGNEFGGSGEDSFVAVVVTKLTGALLFILLLTMVIMALIPRAAESSRESSDGVALQITTPSALPEAIEGRPYALALAADGARGPLAWSLEGTLPAGLCFDAKMGQIHGTPTQATSEPIRLSTRASDGRNSANQLLTLMVYEPEGTLGLAQPSPWRLRISWRRWMEHGFGFLVVALVWMVGLNIVGSVERWSRTRFDNATETRSTGWRFIVYRLIVSAGALAAGAVLIAWLLRGSD